MRKPWYWKARGAWFVRTGKTQIRLHEDEKEAHRIWVSLQTESPTSEVAPFAALADAFLGAVAISPEHRTRTKYYLRNFARRVTCAATEVKPYDVTEWLQSHPAWGPWSQRAAIGAVKRVYAWAAEQGLIDKSPLAAVKKPPAKRREQLITDTQHAGMIAWTDPHFRPFLIALKHSGARPGTVAAVTASEIAQDATLWILRQHKTAAKTGKPLIVYLSPCLQTLTKILAQSRTGNLFTNKNRKPWTRNAIRCRMRRLRAALGLPAGVVAYAYRHTFVTRSLLAGNDAATVAELVGHSDLTMIARHYGHLDQAKEHLAKAVAKTNAKQG